jgi:hypothetical protein
LQGQKTSEATCRTVTNEEVVEQMTSCRLFKNAQMQVEPCEIPFAGAFEKYREKRSRWAFFNSL